MTRATLTRGEAHALIEACGDDLAALLTLQEHWFGHAETAPGETPADTAGILWEYVDSCTGDFDEVGNRGLRDSDNSNLTAPTDKVTP